MSALLREKAELVDVLVHLVLERIQVLCAPALHLCVVVEQYVGYVEVVVPVLVVGLVGGGERGLALLAPDE